MSFELFDRSLKYNWDLPPCDRSFDPEKIERYVSQFDKHEQMFLRDLFASTKYITFQELKEKLQIVFERFAETVGKEEFYILLPKKFGSEHWMIALVWRRMRELGLRIKGFVRVGVKVNLPFANFLIIDDATYSGTMICETIDYFIYEETDLDVEKCRFFIVVPFASECGVNNITRTCSYLKTNFRLFVYESLPKFDFQKWYPLENDEGTARDPLYDKFQIEHREVSPVYTDWKIPAICAVPTCIYENNLYKTRPSREKIEELYLLSIISDEEFEELRRLNTES